VDQATQVSLQNKGMDVFGTRVMALQGRRAADLGTLRDPNQARSLGRKHWPSKQEVLAGSIGQASKESWPKSLAEQAKSLDRIHWLSKEQVKTGWDYGRANERCVPYHFWTNKTQQELGFGSFLFWIFSSYQVKIQQYVGTRTQ
jgi:hypothetical protein